MGHNQRSVASVRRLLGHLAIVWVVAQLAAPVFAITVLGAEVHAGACTCTHGVDAACPMHHRPASGSGTCVLQRTAEPAAALAATLFGLSAIASERTPPAAPAASTKLRLREHQITEPHSEPPDPPPPRL
jgi:hypothetical protein